MNNEKQLLNFKDACELLNIKESHLRSLLFQKKIPHVKVGRLIRFSKIDLEEWINSKMVEVAND